MMRYVRCPVTITSPAADPREPPYLPPNMTCEKPCPVLIEAAVMDFRCPRGHRFMATPEQIQVSENI